MGVGHDTDPLNRSKATKFAFQIGLLHIVTESRHKESLVRITPNLGIFIGIILLHPFCQEPLQLLLFLRLDARLSLEPTLRWMVWNLLAIFLQFRHILCHASQCAFLDVIRGAINRRKISKWRARREEGKKVGRELVRHCCAPSLNDGCDKNSQREDGTKGA